MGSGGTDVIDGGIPVAQNGAGGEPPRPNPDELRVMQLLAEGYSDPQIARMLGISLVTVRRRAQRFTHALGAKSRLQAMAEAVARGWIHASSCAEDPGSCDR